MANLPGSVPARASLTQATANCCSPRTRRAARHMRLTRLEANHTGNKFSAGVRHSFSKNNRHTPRSRMRLRDNLNLLSEKKPWSREFDRGSFIIGTLFLEANPNAATIVAGSDSRLSPLVLLGINHVVVLVNVQFHVRRIG